MNQMILQLPLHKKFEHVQPNNLSGRYVEVRLGYRETERCNRSQNESKGHNELQSNADMPAIAAIPTLCMCAEAPLVMQSVHCEVGVAEGNEYDEVDDVLINVGFEVW